jgi:hypothetical protein
MDLSDFYPSPEDLIGSEVSVLDHLRRNPYIKEKHPQVALDAENYYFRYRISQTGFEFHSYFDIWHAAMHRGRVASKSKGKAKSNARLTVSSRIELENGSFTNVTYCLSVCKIQSTVPSARVTILRKFHFDVTVANRFGGHRRQQHPQCHLQYCGKMVPYMATVGCRATQLEQMHPWLSEPRIFFWPISLALLIDMALREFPDQGSAKFREDSYWRGLVRSQESLVLRPFYEKCVEIIKDNRGESRTLADAFYIT